MNTEINEDNCVLDETDLALTEVAFLFIAAEQKRKPDSHLKIDIHKSYTELFQKINKLNEMAKEKQK